MKRYTLGFVFNATLDKVLLIHKSRPAHHAGKINGLGGKIDGDESPLTCIVREIKEESDLTTLPEKWVYIGEQVAPSWHVETYCYVYEGSMDDAKTMEDQPLEWFDVKNLPANVIGNLNWLIPLCLDKLRNDDLSVYSIKAEYKN